MDILKKLYSKVVCLEDWLYLTSDKLQGKLVLQHDPERYKNYLQTVYIGVPSDVKPYSASSVSQHSVQSDTILRAIERVLMTKGSGNNVLTHGYGMLSNDPTAQTCGGNIENRYPNSCVNQFFNRHWKTLLNRIGDQIVSYMLEHMSVFLEVQPTCFIQLAGTPVYDLWSFEAGNALMMESKQQRYQQTTCRKQQYQSKKKCVEARAKTFGNGKTVLNTCEQVLGNEIKNKQILREHVNENVEIANNERDHNQVNDAGKKCTGRSKSGTRKKYELNSNEAKWEKLRTEAAVFAAKNEEIQLDNGTEDLASDIECRTHETNDTEYLNGMNFDQNTIRKRKITELEDTLDDFLDTSNHERFRAPKQRKIAMGHSSKSITDSMSIDITKHENVVKFEKSKHSEKHVTFSEVDMEIQGKETSEVEDKHEIANTQDLISDIDAFIEPINASYVDMNTQNLVSDIDELLYEFDKTIDSTKKVNVNNSIFMVGKLNNQLLLANTNIIKDTPLRLGDEIENDSITVISEEDNLELNESSRKHHIATEDSDLLGLKDMPSSRIRGETPRKTKDRLDKSGNSEQKESVQESEDCILIDIESLDEVSNTFRNNTDMKTDTNTTIMKTSQTDNEKNTCLLTKSKHRLTNLCKKKETSKRKKKQQRRHIDKSYKPFSHHHLLPRGSVLFTRNVRERIPKYATISKLEPSSQGVLDLYKSIFVDTKVHQSDCNVRVTAPDIQDIEGALGIGTQNEAENMTSRDSELTGVDGTFSNKSHDASNDLFDSSEAYDSFAKHHPSFKNNDSAYAASLPHWNEYNNTSVINKGRLSFHQSGNIVSYNSTRKCNKSATKKQNFHEPSQNDPSDSHTRSMYKGHPSFFRSSGDGDIHCSAPLLARAIHTATVSTCACAKCLSIESEKHLNQEPDKCLNRELHIKAYTNSYSATGGSTSLHTNKGGFNFSESGNETNALNIGSSGSLTTTVDGHFTRKLSRKRKWEDTIDEQTKQRDVPRTQINVESSINKTNTNQLDSGPDLNTLTVNKKKIEKLKLRKQSILQIKSELPKKMECLDDSESSPKTMYGSIHANCSHNSASSHTKSSTHSSEDSLSTIISPVAMYKTYYENIFTGYWTQNSFSSHTKSSAEHSEDTLSSIISPLSQQEKPLLTETSEAHQKMNQPEANGNFDKTLVNHVIIENGSSNSIIRDNAIRISDASISKSTNLISEKRDSLSESKDSISASRDCLIRDSSICGSNEVNRMDSEVVMKDLQNYGKNAKECDTDVHVDNSSRVTDSCEVTDVDQTTDGDEITSVPFCHIVVPLLQEFIKKCRRCPFKELLNYHCPAHVGCKQQLHGGKSGQRKGHRPKRPGNQGNQGNQTIVQLLKDHHHQRQVYLFLRACILRCLPEPLLGGRHNRNVLLKHLSKLNLKNTDNLCRERINSGLSCTTPTALDPMEETAH